METALEIMHKLLQEMTGEQISFEDLLKRTLIVSNQEVRARFLNVMSYVYNELMPFNKHIGINIESLNMEAVKTRIDMKDELIGNFEKRILHGGVISSVLDLTGGIIAQVSALTQMNGYTIGEVISSFSKMSTVNLRVDFLSPGRGKFFITTGTVIRSGNKVAVTRMELYNNTDELIALGTGTYLIG